MPFMALPRPKKGVSCSGVPGLRRAAAVTPKGRAPSPSPRAGPRLRAAEPRACLRAAEPRAAALRGVDKGRWNTGTPSDTIIVGNCGEYLGSVVASKFSSKSLASRDMDELGK
ncbi:hypothetical protein DV515_00015814 [Chloebia gouldiae]|uniref:Uncharacterized protein n=1 Tax=Chloebia gouldiae TaxID=44316 RepID=A0A3L8RU91_CHLGU|nr:hypothetical protein DV515_00015814 [Chloebia gouldiae]